MPSFKIKDLESFCYPLLTIKNSINSVIFFKDGDGLGCNAISSDKTQSIDKIANLKWSSKVVETDITEKIGIYNLSEFLGVLNIFDSDEAEGTIADNRMILKFNNSRTTINYILSDISLITEGPEKLKVDMDTLISFGIEKDFLKKIKNVSSKLSIGILKFENIKGKVSYFVSDKHFHSHIVKEELFKTDVKDFEIYINIEKLNIIPEGKEFKLNILEKGNIRLMEVLVNDNNYTLQRYYLAPLNYDKGE